jgi:hypothetical protein
MASLMKSLFIKRGSIKVRSLITCMRAMDFSSRMQIPSVIKAVNFGESALISVQKAGYHRRFA